MTYFEMKHLNQWAFVPEKIIAAPHRSYIIAIICDKILLFFQNYESDRRSYTKRFGLIVLSALLALGTPCSAAVVERARDDAITIAGSIDKNTIVELKAKIDARVRLIAIASAGGDFASDIAVGKFVRQNNLTVYVSKYCLAGCAQWIFVAANHRVIESNAIVSFHPTATALEITTSKSSDEKIRNFFYETSAKEKEYYREIGVPEILLVQPLAELNPTCYYVLKDKNNDLVDVRVKVSYSAWIPSQDYMNKLGISFSGFWPSSGEAFATALQTDQKFKPDAGFIWGERLESPSTEKIAESLSTLEECAVQPAKLQTNGGQLGNEQQ